MSKSVLSVETRDNAVVAAVTCPDLDHDTTQRLQHDLEAALAAAPTASLVLDISKVEFAPSLALGLLVKVHKNLTQAGRKCFIVGVAPNVLEALKVTNLDRFLKIHANAEEGLKHV